MAINKTYYPFLRWKATTIIILSLLVLSCSTKKNTFTRRLFHNVTSKYNAYFNGNESFKEGVLLLEDAQKDDFNKILSVFPYGTKENAQTIYPQMDRAIAKATKVIRKHSIYIKHEEHVRWIDDSYLLMGKANFYKQEYRPALRIFDFITKQYSKNPIKYEAMLWLARLYNQTGEFEKSKPYLDLVKAKASQKDASNTIKRELPMVYADYFIQQKDYNSAIKYLEAAIEINHKRQVKARLEYILAQIYQNNNYFEKAAALYQKVIKANPSYDMAFNANTNLAKCYNASPSMSKQLKKKLFKMLRDEKNKDFRDQIYFSLAEVALKEKNIPAAIEYLKLSIKTSVSNNYQKAISSLKLAEIYFSQKNYEASQAYYDTTMMNLPKDYPDYQLLERKTKSLTQLVKNLQTIYVEDSLQTLAKMSEEERMKIIDKAIEAYKKKEQERQEEELNNQQQITLQPKTSSPIQSLASSSSWYFYNPAAKSMGYNEFNRKWGKRRLEDNWRLSNKQSININFAEEQTKIDSTTADSNRIIFTNPKDRKTYLQNIPLSEKQLKNSNDRIAEAYYNIGLIYRNEINDSKKAVDYFEMLLKRFPQSKYELEAYYNLYKLYLDTDEKVNAEKYRTLILANYPNSDYAKLILNPNYIYEIQTRKNQLALLYSQTYQAFNTRQYFTVIENANQAQKNFDDKILLPKFEYLKALSLGKITRSNDTLEVNLNKLLAKYPDSEIKPLAQNILDFISINKQHPAVTSTTTSIGKDAEPIIAQKAMEPKSPYVYDSTDIHFYVLIIDAVQVKMFELKNRIADFNTKYFSLNNLNVSSVFLDDRRQMITVSDFPNKEKAIDYLNTIQNNTYVFSPISTTDFKQFAISVTNYSPFYKDKNTDKYMLFFKKNYLK